MAARWSRRDACVNENKEEVMKRMMIVARLRDGTQAEAEALLAHGPPFDPEELGLERHAAYLTSGEVVFVFEGTEVEWTVNDILDNPAVGAALAPWREIADGMPHIAHERFYWTRGEGKLGVGLGA
jgi:hypothetical protein